MRTDFNLGDWIIRPQRCRIERGDEAIHLKPKSMAVLECLARAEGNVVSRNDLFDAVWHGGIVSDDVLTQSVVELRKAFGDSAHDAQIIETIPKMGFRLIPPVLPLKSESEHTHAISTGSDASVEQPIALHAKDKGHPATSTLFIAAGAVLILITSLWYVSSDQERSPILTIDDPKPIAVLPFVDMSPDKDYEYFADGLSEELLNRLAQLDGLQVTGRTSSFYFKGKDVDLQQIREALNVDYFLEGSVRVTENQVRITTQLVDATNGVQLWSETYDRALDEIFVIYNEISEGVATALSVKLSVGKLAGMQGGTTNLNAYNEVLLGNQQYRKFTRDSVLKAIEHFKHATEIDTDYALAWARLADIYVTGRIVGVGVENWQQTSKDALARATSLAPNSPALIRAIAFRYMHLGQWGDVDRTSSRLDSYEKVSGLVQTLAIVGRTREAIETFERYRRLEPLSGAVAWNLGHVYAQAGRLDESLAELERGFSLGEFLNLISNEGLVVALSIGDKNLIRKWLARVLQNQPEDRGVHWKMVTLLEDREAALDWLRKTYETRPSPEPGSIPPPEQMGEITIWAAYFGDAELALSAMQKSRNLWVYWMPLILQVRRLPDFKELVQDVGFVGYWREFSWGDYCHPIGNDDFECE